MFGCMKVTSGRTRMRYWTHSTRSITSIHRGSPPRGGSMATGSTSSWVPDGDFTDILRVDCRLSKVRDRRLLSSSPSLDRLVEPSLKPSARRCVFDQSSATSPSVTTVWLNPASEPIPSERVSATGYHGCREQNPVGSRGLMQTHHTCTVPRHRAASARSTATPFVREGRGWVGTCTWGHRDSSTPAEIPAV
jgi:hypothetical protein